MPEELRVRLVEAAQAEGRSLNREIVHRLEESVEARVPSERPGRVLNRGEYMRYRRRRLAVVAAAALALVVSAAVALA